MAARLNSDDRRFEAALKVVLDHEGGFVNHPNDPGGATNYGVSLRWLKSLGDLGGDLDHDGDVDIDDIRKLTPGMAGIFYRRNWWDKYEYHRLPQGIAVKAFDLSVNMGARQAHKILQRAIRAALQVNLEDDGVIGEKTRLALQVDFDMALVVVAMRSEAAGFYRQLAATKPKFQVFLDGWLKRAYF